MPLREFSAANSFRRTRAQLDHDVESRRYCYGTQIYVSCEGRVLLDTASGCDGLGRPLTADTVSAIYCAAKPILAVLVADLVATGTLRLADRLGALVPELRGLPAGDAQVADVLTHTAGLHALRSVVAAAYPPTARQRLALSAGPPQGWEPAAQAAYSEWLGWYFLKLAIESLTGKSFRRRAETLLREIGIEDTICFGMDDDVLWRRRDAIGVNVDLTGEIPRPLLLERAYSWCTEDDPSLSGLGTMRALGRFYEWVLAMRAGPVDREDSRSALLRAFTSPQRPVLHDDVLQRACSWGYGFMTGLSALGFGEHVSEEAFGHTGQVGTSVAFADPRAGLVVAVLYNGLIDPEEGMAKRRPAIVNAIYEDLASDCGVLLPMSATPYTRGDGRRAACP